MAMNHNSPNHTTAASAQAPELRCTLCSGQFPSPQAFNCHMVRRVVNLNPHVMTRVIHYPVLPPLPSPLPSDDDDSSDSDSMASLASDSTESDSGSTVSCPPPQPLVQPRPRQVALNLLGDWEAPLAELFAREAAAARAANGPIQASVDLELSLKYAPAATTTVDLDLKLGL